MVPSEAVGAGHGSVVSPYSALGAAQISRDGTIVAVEVAQLPGVAGAAAVLRVSSSEPSAGNSRSESPEQVPRHLAALAERRPASRRVSGE
jgi:hypothetical protein